MNVSEVRSGKSSTEALGDRPITGQSSAQGGLVKKVVTAATRQRRQLHRDTQGRFEKSPYSAPFVCWPAFPGRRRPGESYTVVEHLRAPGGMTGLCKTYGQERLDSDCRRAPAFDDPRGHSDWRVGERVYRTCLFKTRYLPAGHNQR